MINKIKEKCAEGFDDVKSNREHLHTIPELAFEEVKTAAFIEEKLQEMDIPYKKGIAKMGIVGTIEGKNPSKKIIGLQADLDALPIIEKNDISYKSTHEGNMHACGHDVHMACALGAAKILMQSRDEWEGTVQLIFQPAEEKLPGGATVMISEGVLEDPKVDSIIALHVMPELDAGKVGFRAGQYMASADEVYITVKGVGGHGAMPQSTIDPVLIASHIIVALQQVVSRNAHPAIPSVLSFGKIIAEGATNVIPEEVKIEGTFRTMDEDWREKAHQMIKRIGEKVAESMGGSCDIKVDKGYPSLFNNVKLANNSKSAAIEYLGADNVVDLDVRMTSDDFAYYSHIIPGCYFRLGVRNESDGINSPVHTATFNIDNKALEIGSGLLSWLLINELSEQ